jgi:hypothetical protein
MDFINADEKIKDLTKGYLDHADGQWYIDYYNSDKPSFWDLVKSDISLSMNVEED